MIMRLMITIEWEQLLNQVDAAGFMLQLTKQKNLNLVFFLELAQKAE
jgi:uncharacterized protein YcgL (UPF0745 family)